jgi:hypothetical protein
MADQATKSPPEVFEGQAPNESDDLTFEVGRKLFLESTDNGREYCKHMITIASSAIPVYLALLGKDRVMQADLLLGLPPFLFLLGVAAFSWGYYPRQFLMNTAADLNIEEVRLSLMHHRLKWGTAGFLAFVLGILSSVPIVLWRA